MKSKDTQFHWSPPLVSCSNQLDQGTESLSHKLAVLLQILLAAIAYDLHENWTKGQQLKASVETETDGHKK